MKAMKLSTIILLALSIGCMAKSKDNILDEARLDEVQFQNQLAYLQGQDHDPEFLIYTQEYEYLKGSSINSNVRIFFSDVFNLPSNHYWINTHGLCIDFDVFKLILINRKVWFSFSLSEIESMNHAHLDRYANEDISYRYIRRDDHDPALTKRINYYRQLSDEYKKGIIEDLKREESKFSPIDNINIRNWRRKILLFHELGHCDLNREHLYGTIEKKVPSIMDYDVMDSMNRMSLDRYSTIDNAFEELIEELFHPL